MAEEFLHFIWQNRLIKQSGYLADGQEYRIIRPGKANEDAGPDFLEAKIRIGNTLWAGHVEIHLRSSDWFRHGHQKDSLYRNVILHVVMQHDQEVAGPGGEAIPVLELDGKYDPELYDRYRSIMESLERIPCSTLLESVGRLTLTSTIDRMVVQRLMDRALRWEKLLKEYRGDWAAVFYTQLCRNFGFKVNNDPMEMMARATPYRVLLRHSDNLFQIESILFGQAGMLSGRFDDTYRKRLRTEYRFLSSKYHLTPCSELPWRFLRLRPSNFPTLRIAQFAALIHRTPHLPEVVKSAASVKEIVSILDCEPSEYWHTHYLFGKRSAKTGKKPGKTAINLLLINTIIPFLFAYGLINNREDYRAKALRWLETLPREQNSIIRQWQTAGLPATSAYQTQGLLELYNGFCNKKKCLNCSIGLDLLKKSEDFI